MGLLVKSIYQCVNSNYKKTGLNKDNIQLVKKQSQFRWAHIQGKLRMYKKIALATDGSEHSKRAAENAMKIAKCTPNSKIEVLYVVDHDKVKSDVLSDWNAADIGDCRKIRMKEVERMAQESGVSYVIKILHGDPGPVIVNYVNKNNFEIAIIGSRGLNGLQEFVLGSVSHKVAKRANCPVLIVK